MSPIFVLLFAALFAVAPARDYKKRDDTSDTLESDLDLPVVRNYKAKNLGALYIPGLIPLGDLPENPDGVKFYDLYGVPPNAKEVFLYIFVTTNGDGYFQRGYFEISTTAMPGGPEYMQYMNVATGQDLLAVNSENMWFPVGTGKLKVKLIHPADKKRSIAGRTTDENEWSGVFIIGYR